MVVEVKGIPIRLHERGSGRSLLLVHGWSADHRYLCADLDPVPDRRGGWRRVAFDLPGHHVGRIERPGLFGALVDDWLARIEQEERP